MKKMMKKNMKKIVSIALVLVLLLVPFSYLLNVKALEIEFDASTKKVENTSTITVNASSSGINSLTGDVLKAYKVLDAYYDSASNQISYDFTEGFEAFLASDYADTDTKNFASLTVDEYVGYGAEDADTDEFELLVAQFAKYVKANSVDDSYTLTVAENGLSASVSNVVVGSYLVLPTVTTKVFAAMLGNVAIVAENGSWVLKAAEITAKGYTIGESFDDSQSESGKTKSIFQKGLASASVVVGEEYEYYVSTALPKYPANASNTTFVITETLDAGISFSGITNMSIYDGGKDDGTLLTNTDGTFTNSSGLTVASASYDSTNNKITISFNPNNASSQLIDIVYKASLNSDAPYGTEINSSSVLTYAVDPYSTLTGANKTTGASTAQAYTYGLKVNNIKVNNNSTKLAGSQFALYKVDAEGNKTGSAIATATTTTDGYIVFDKGIAATSTGTTYVLVQTKASAGYRVASDKTISLNLGNTTVDTSDGVSYYDTTSKTFVVTVANTEAGLLPSTGGLGTILYTLIGLFIIAFSATAVVYYRKKKNAVTE